MRFTKTNVHTANPHHGSVQRGKDFDVVFANNLNTETYWDMQNDAEQDADVFPMWVEDWYGFLWFAQDYLDNWKNDGIRFTDGNLTLITKSGTIISSDYFESATDFAKALRPFNPNHFAAAIYNEYGYEYFWVNGWDGYQALQEYTGWFDMDIYYDWI